MGHPQTVLQVTPAPFQVLTRDGDLLLRVIKLCL